MATLQLTPPEPFNFKAPDEWPRWRTRFQQFRIASGLAGDSAAKQVSTLLYCLGEEAESVLSSTDATEDDRKDYDTVMNKFDEYFKVRRNVIYERARFNRRSQQPGETSEQFIMALYDLAANCNYGELRDEMIRDRIVVGIRNTSLSERLQLNAELTLEKAKQAVRQSEAVHEQNQSLTAQATPGNIDAVQPKAYRKQYSRYNSGGKQRNTTPPKGVTKHCPRCGKEPHSRENCPAKNAICNKCKKRNHFASVCRSKTTSEVVTTTPAPEAFLDNVASETPEQAWVTRLELCGQVVTFKIDTGAEVTAINEETHRQVGEPPLTPADRKLLGPSTQPLTVLGSFAGDFNHKQRKSKQVVYVVKGLQNNLLGLPAICALQLIARLHGMQTKEDVLQQFPKVFKGLGNLGEPFHIKLKSDAKPTALSTPRNISLPLRPKVATELAKMEEAGIISRVDEPTPWCAGMVVVPKKSGSVRICVDLKPLNESVLREVHPLPKVDETLAQLTGAKVFSKLDANSGFWQIPLSEESRLLTTFITPVGRFCFNKLPFGISSAPEHFQKHMSAVLCGLEGVVCQMDDVLIFGRDQQEHDARLFNALTKIRNAGVTLNPEKCEVSKNSIKFLGHVIDTNGISPDPEKTRALHQMSQPSNVSGLRRFLGMANQLGKFSPNLASLTQPLRELLGKRSIWRWDKPQETAFENVKQELTAATIFVFVSTDSTFRFTTLQANTCIQRTHCHAPLSPPRLT